jgi:hypothetical protein
VRRTDHGEGADAGRDHQLRAVAAAPGRGNNNWSTVVGKSADSFLPFFIDPGKQKSEIF